MSIGYKPKIAPFGDDKLNEEWAILMIFLQD